jgi:hypothetical protein
VTQILPLLLWIGIVAQLLLGIRLVGEASGMWAEAFHRDYDLAVCGRYRAMAANLRDAVATWRKSACAGEDEVDVENEVEDYLLAWQGHYRDWDPDSCGGEGPLRVKLRREENPDLDNDYPNWVVRYE